MDAFAAGLTGVGLLLVSVSLLMISRRFLAIKSGRGSWAGAMTTLVLYGMIFVLGSFMAFIGILGLMNGDSDRAMTQ